jgi:hypothetical protein
MEWNLHPRIIGACVIGFALVAGAYVLSTFGQSNFQNQAASVGATNAPRVAIEVVDTDSNGIEDWRDTFITTEPLVIEPTDSTYIPPTTLTGQLGIDFMEDYIRSKSYGPFGRDREVVVENAVNILTNQSVYKLYDTPDIIILTEAADADVVMYANTIALAITNNNLDQTETELDILGRILKTAQPAPDETAKIAEIAQAYAMIRDQTLATPVPIFLAKQHLDLINTYNAVHEGIAAMALVDADPALTLIRLRRYQDDVLGLRIALQNMYTGLEPYAALVGAEDPALLFVIFSEEFNS